MHHSTSSPAPGRRRSVAAVAIGAALVAGACSSNGTSSSTGTTAPGSSAVSGTTPGTRPAGITLPDAATLDALVAKEAEDLIIPGGGVIIITPDGEYRSAFGVRRIGADDKVTLDDHFRIGSNTKTMTATIILQLAQEGKLSLDDKVGTYVKGVPNGDQITLAQLLEMRSGLPNYSTSPVMNEQLDNNPSRVWTDQELLDLAFAGPVDFAPGAEYEYSNTNYLLLGMIAEQLDGKDLPAIFEDRIFAPLGMTQSEYPARGSAAIPEPHPRGYFYSTNVATLDSSVLPEDEQKAAYAGTLLPNDVTDANPSWAGAAGAGISTADDLVTWVQALGTGQLLDPEWQEKRMDSVRATSPGNPAAPGYGYGIAKMGPLFGHTGELPGFNSFMGYDPVNDVTIVVWSNLATTPKGELAAVELAKALMGEIYGTSAGAGAPSAASETPATTKAG